MDENYGLPLANQAVRMIVQFVPTATGSGAVRHPQRCFCKKCVVDSGRYCTKLPSDCNAQL
jgi:hypothetical protein